MNRQASASEVLLISEVLVGRQKEIERAFSRVQQIAVVEVSPIQLRARLRRRAP